MAGCRDLIKKLAVLFDISDLLPIYLGYHVARQETHGQNAVRCFGIHLVTVVGCDQPQVFEDGLWIVLNALAVAFDHRFDVALGFLGVVLGFGPFRRVIGAQRVDAAHGKRSRLWKRQGLGVSLDPQDDMVAEHRLKRGRVGDRVADEIDPRRLGLA